MQNGAKTLASLFLSITHEVSRASLTPFIFVLHLFCAAPLFCHLFSAAADHRLCIRHYDNRLVTLASNADHHLQHATTTPSCHPPLPKWHEHLHHRTVVSINKGAPPRRLSPRSCLHLCHHLPSPSLLSSFVI
jgi:hypothetical protein